MERPFGTETILHLNGMSLLSISEESIDCLHKQKEWPIGLIDGRYTLVFLFFSCSRSFGTLVPFLRLETFISTTSFLSSNLQVPRLDIIALARLPWAHDKATADLNDQEFMIRHFLRRLYCHNRLSKGFFSVPLYP